MTPKHSGRGARARIDRSHRLEGAVGGSGGAAGGAGSGQGYSCEPCVRTGRVHRGGGHVGRVRPRRWRFRWRPRRSLRSSGRERRWGRVRWSGANSCGSERPTPGGLRPPGQGPCCSASRTAHGARPSVRMPCRSGRTEAAPPQRKGPDRPGQVGRKWHHSSGHDLDASSREDRIPPETPTVSVEWCGLRPSDPPSGVLAGAPPSAVPLRGRTPSLRAWGRTPGAANLRPSPRPSTVVAAMRALPAGSVRTACLPGRAARPPSAPRTRRRSAPR